MRTDNTAQPIERRIANLRDEIKMTTRTIAVLSKGGHETAGASHYLNGLLTALSALNQVQKNAS